MSSRGWKYRCYADEPETPIADLICCLLGGITGFYGFPGWVLIAVGVLCPTCTITTGAVIGLLLWGRLIYESMQERREAELRR